MAAVQPDDGGLRVPVAIECSLWRQSDPVGATLACSIPDAPNREIRQELLDQLETRLVTERGSLVFQAIRVSHGTLNSYGGRNDYHVESITESVQVNHERGGRGLVVRWYWEHEGAQYLNFGVSPHTIDGNPILSFIWEDAPQSVREMFPHTERVGGDPRVFFQSVNWGSDTGGIPAAHFVRAGTRWLRQQLTD